jgi:ribosomal protein L11 methyltransferase
VPSWIKNPQPERLEIKIDPGMAFGSGTHATTQLCLILLERYLAENPSYRMIDIGCGSGILAIAGIKLGAGYVLGVDNDPDTIRVAADNALINHSGDSIDFRFGSLAEIRQGQFEINKAHLVAANIIAPIIIELLEEGLDEIVLPGGSLLLSGILVEQLPEILDLLVDKGMVVREKLQRGEWVAIWVAKVIEEPREI